jgi:hypothetical protein
MADQTALGGKRGYWWSPGSDALLVAWVDTSMAGRRERPGTAVLPTCSIRWASGAESPCDLAAQLGEGPGQPGS